MCSIGESGFRSRFRILQSEAMSENGFQLREIRPQDGFKKSNRDFHLNRLIGKSIKGFGKSSREQWSFFILLMRARARPLFLTTAI